MTVRADFRFVPSQWETSLQSNGASYWLGANLESALTLFSTMSNSYMFTPHVIIMCADALVPNRRHAISNHTAIHAFQRRHMSFSNHRQFDCFFLQQSVQGNVRENTEALHYWSHDDVIKWKHFPRYWPFVRGIHRSRWIPRTKASDAELWCFLWSTPE